MEIPKWQYDTHPKDENWEKYMVVMLTYHLEAHETPIPRVERVTKFTKCPDVVDMDI